MSEASLVAFIPARGGSKGIPGKNMAALDSKPLIDHTITAARDAGVFVRVIVSTDDRAIAEHAESMSCEVHRRPPRLAADDSRVVDALLDAATTMRLGEDDVVFVLQPTSPLRRAEHIRTAVRLQRESPTGSLVSVVECEHHPLKSVRVEDGLLRAAFERDHLESSRQDLPRMFRPNGAIYATRLSDVRSSRTLVPTGAAVMVMSREDSADVDSPDDLEYAEFLLHRRR